MALLLALAAILTVPAPRAAAGPLPDGDTCVDPEGRRAVCMSVRDGAPTHVEDLTYDDVGACVYDEFLGVVLWWFGGTMLACGQTHHWSYLSMQGACLWTGANTPEDPPVCIGVDRRDDIDEDGDDETVHCTIWIAGSGHCFYD